MGRGVGNGSLYLRASVRVLGGESMPVSPGAGGSSDASPRKGVDRRKTWISGDGENAGEKGRRVASRSREKISVDVSTSKLTPSRNRSKRNVTMKKSHRDIIGSPIDRRKMQLTRRESEVAQDTKNDALSPDIAKRNKKDGSISSLNNKDCHSPAKGTRKSRARKGRDRLFSLPRHRNPSLQISSKDGFAITAKIMSPNMRGVSSDAKSAFRQKSDSGRDKSFIIKRNLEPTSVKMEVLFDKKWTEMIDTNTIDPGDRWASMNMQSEENIEVNSGVQASEKGPASRIPGFSRMASIETLNNPMTGTLTNATLVDPNTIKPSLIKARTERVSPSPSPDCLFPDR